MVDRLINPRRITRFHTAEQTRLSQFAVGHLFRFPSFLVPERKTEENLRNVMHSVMVHRN